MRAEVTFLSRRSRGAVVRKSQKVEAETVRFGRGSDNEVQLPDIRVPLAAAVLRPDPVAFIIDRTKDVLLRVNGETVASAPVAPGSEIIIGPYKIVLTKPPEGFDVAFSVDLFQPMDDALVRLRRQARIGLENSGLSKRRAAWALFLLLAAVGIALPIVAYVSMPAASSKSVPTLGALALLAMLWNPGELSNPHRFFASSCVTCHRQSFAAVPDRACLTCHTAVGAHAERAAQELAGAAGRRLVTTRCAVCHEEHRGRTALVIDQPALCVSCHASLAGADPRLDVRNVTGFPVGHPQFRVTLVADPAKRSIVRSELGKDPRPVDHPNMTFSHAAHLAEKGVLSPTGRRQMVCADCHTPDSAGRRFLPITYRTQCHSCHNLKFDVDLPWGEVPHDDVAAVRIAIEDFYGRQALQGAIPDPAAAETERRRPGAAVTPSEPERRDALAWAAAKTRDALAIVFDEKRGCAYCHLVDKSAGTYALAPVLMRTRFLPHADFDHASHRALACTDCHDSRRSDKSSDVLIPGIEVCTTCHGKQKAALKTPSTCTSCHGFHDSEFGRMPRTTAERR